MTPEVVVIGGGPAGLAVAITLARRGIQTHLVERGRLPQEKPCGEGLLPNAVEALVRLGIDRTDLEAVGHPIAGIRYLARSGRRAEARFPDGHGLGVSRVDLSALLLARARSLPALRIIEARATVIRQPGQAWTVAIGGERLRPALIVGADGLSSPTRRAIGVRTIAGPHKRWGLRQHLDGSAWTDHVEVYFGDGVEAYVTPLRHSINVAFLWDQRAIAVPHGRPAFDWFVSRTPALAGQLRGRRPLDRVRAAGPFDRRAASSVEDGLIFAGDAARYIDALTGEGVGLALQHAEVIDGAVAPLLSGDARPSRRQLTPYARAIADAGRANAQLTRVMLRCSRHPALVDRLIGVLAADPGLFEHCLRVNMGQRSLWRLRVDLLVRLPRALAASGHVGVAQ